MNSQRNVRIRRWKCADFERVDREDFAVKVILWNTPGRGKSR